MYGSELIIRTRRGEEVYELLPLSAIKGDFPHALVQEYAHWLNDTTGLVEWRPLTDAWATSSHNWCMKRDDEEGFYLTQGKYRLIDICSSTAKAISRVLSPLELDTHIHIMVNCESEELEIRLPRFKLDFALKRNSSQLESKQFRGMVVDEDQSFGSFTGLVNKLVLLEVGGTSRAVIVPHGNISFTRDGNHVCIKIAAPPTANVNYHLFRIDSQLGRLVDNGNLKSRLYKLYLHAVTAHCLVDRLTGRTGTEEALYGLAAASTRSFLKLNHEEIELFDQIARLTPQRRYYPLHLRVMQEVDWNPLSPLSQHSSFRKEVASILKHARSFHLFQDEPVLLPSAETTEDNELNQRAATRDSWFRVHNFGAEDFTVDHDIDYASRDIVSNSAREIRTCRTSKLVDDWSTDLRVCSDLLVKIESWNQQLRGPVQYNNLNLGFDLRWLDPPAKFLPDHWCVLQSVLSSSVMDRDKYRIMIFLATLSYSQYIDEELIYTLLAFATVQQFELVRPPNQELFQLSQGYEPQRETLVQITKNHTRSYYECPESRLPNHPFESTIDAYERRNDEYELAKAKGIEDFVDRIIGQWPEASISSPSGCTTYINVQEAMKDARLSFHTWYWNSQFQQYIQRIQVILSGLSREELEVETYSFSRPIDSYHPKRGHICFDDLIKNLAPTLALSDAGTIDCSIISHGSRSNDFGKLRGLLDRLSSECSGGYEQRYVEDLLRSFKAYRDDVPVELEVLPELHVRLLEAHMEESKQCLRKHYELICRHLLPALNTTHGLARKAQMTPRLCPTAILSHLSSDQVVSLSPEWKASLIQYGISIASLQRARRLASCGGQVVDLLAELRNPGHQGWNTMQFPEWLLLEIENNILIREEQAQIAQEMLSPTSGSNSTMQLNMGQGKSSVIVPIIAAALADKKKLVRVVVLKSLAPQMFHLLVEKLGGLLNRRIFYMPISRSFDLDMQQARQIRDLYEECMRTRGVLLVQPEHLLSFELMGFEQLLRRSPELGNMLIQTQRWLDDNSRDVLDESDEILSVRFELIYTIGTQRAVELSPDRWTIVQYVLGIVREFAEETHHKFPIALEVLGTQPGRFPRIRILEKVAGDELFSMVARRLCQFGLPGVPVWNLPQEVRTALFEFLTNPEPILADPRLLQDTAFSSDSMKKSLLLLRGLFAGGILKFAMGHKRWRVNYGLDPSRTMLAVPYHAKDIPATRAEFSHPDATIVLTCLSYYYGGLSDQQLFASFETLLLSDCAREKYEQWVRDAPELPIPFRDINGINLSNSEQCSQQVFPLLRFAKGAVDFYMSHIVFPKEMREFPSKLSSSGWDIAREKLHPTTGFSGTNDSRYMLPLSINQCDLRRQLPTNAAVLDCLLRPENSFVDVMDLSNAEVLDAEVLLHKVVRLDPPVRVILDVGAQVLDLQNEEVVGKWLSLVPEPEAQAAIFFDNRNNLCVLSRDGTKEPLMVSSLAKQMDQCLVYLDEAHTRGTDLRMPTDYRAVVTLGPGLTKDRLVQGMFCLSKLVCLANTIQSVHAYAKIGTGPISRFLRPYRCQTQNS